MSINAVLCLCPLLCHAIEGTWTPRNRFWKHYQETQEGLCAYEEDYDNDEGVDAFDVIPDCLYEAAGNIVDLKPSQPDPRVANIIKDPFTNKTLAVGIANAISPQEAQAVRALANCARRVIPNRFETREFGGGGNDCTYLTVLLPLFLPTVAATVQRTAEVAYDAANWKEQVMISWNATYKENVFLPPPGELGVRSSEHLTYKTIKHIGGHTDKGSIYTVVFSLSDPDTFQGGEFFLQTPTNGTYVYLKPNKYSAVVFLSEETHGVENVRDGVRETFATEYWPFDDTPWDEWRPSRPEIMELFTKRMEGVENFASVATEWMWPTTKELEAYLVETGRFKVREEGYGNVMDEDDDYEEDWDEEDV